MHSPNNKNFALRKEAGPPAVLLRRRQRMMIVNNRFQALQSVDSTGGMTTVVFCLQQLWSDAKSNRRPY